MSRLRDELFNAKIENATLRLEVEAARRERDDFKEKLNTAEHHLNIERDRHRETTTQVHELDKKNGILLERLDLLANHLPPPPSQPFNVMSEEQEDADYALRAGIIDRDEYEAILASAGALNTEITFDSDTLTRL